MAMPTSTHVTATVGAVLLLFRAQPCSAHESSQQSPPTTDIPERYRRQVAPTPSTYWRTPALHDYTGVLESAGAPRIDANKRTELPELIDPVLAISARSSVRSIPMAAHPLVAG